MCFSISAPTESQEDHMNAPSASNSLSKTLDGYQLVPSFPNPNGSCAGEIPTRDDPLQPPAAHDIYYRNSDKQAQLEDPEPSSSFQLVNDDFSSPWSSELSSKEYGSWHSSSSRVSTEEARDSELTPEENWLASEDAGAPSRNEFSASAIVPSGVGAGLANLGNTCFINAILQCFTHTVPLIQGLRSCGHSAPCDGDIDGFCVICAFCDQFEHSLAASGGILSPLKLVDNLNYFSSIFRRYQQEDAHEFMQCALDKLERCFLDLKKNNKSFEDDNLVEKVFGGRLISKLRCCNCGHSSDTYEPLIDLSLEIENVDTLPSALESFTKVENIDAKFRCDSCKEEVFMEKQLMLDQTPSVAAFHLKRFKADGTYVEKIDNHVDFPLELDLQPYTTSNQNNVPLKYDLYAVVVHIGFSSTSGHYFCFVRSAPDIWHRLDDAKVTRVLGDSVLSQKAYILFYARQGTPWFSSIMESPMPCLDPSILSTSPKSVLDNVDSLYKSHPILATNIVRGEASESKEFAEQKSNYSCGERHELLEVNDTNDASHGFEKFPSGTIQESVGLKGSGDITHAQVPLGNNAILNATFVGNSYTESAGHDQNNCCQEVVDMGENDGFHPLTPPSSPTPDAPDMSYHIPLDHLKMESRGSCKRPLNKSMEDSERQVAVSYLKKNMPGSRRDKLLELVGCHSEPSLNKKRKKMDSSLCKKGSPHSVRKKSNHSSVMRPVAAISR